MNTRDSIYIEVCHSRSLPTVGQQTDSLSYISNYLNYKVPRMFINVSISISISSSSASACIAVRNYQIDPTFLYYIVPGCPTTSYISGPYV